MTNKRSFFKLGALLLCLLSLSFVSLRAVYGQKEQQQEGARKYVIVEDDIQVSLEEYQELIAAGRSPQSAYRPQATNFWPNGVVPFEFDSNCVMGSTTCVTGANQAAMFSAMAVLEGAANVDFRQCGGNRCSGNYVHIQNSNVNNSRVGVRGGRQDINITSWGTQFIIVHELLHCLGFYHEQSRPDRGDFITINCGNIRGDSGDCTSNSAQVDFNIINQASVYREDASIYGYYDFDSLMHYSQCSFSVGCGTDASGNPLNNCLNCSGRPTISVKAPYNTQTSPDGVQWPAAIGQRTRLSNLDLLTLSFLYPRPDWRFVDVNYKGGNGAPDGSFPRPYQSLETAVSATPVGGVLWVQPGNYIVVRPLNRRITMRAPLGGVTIRKGDIPLSGGGPLATVSAANYHGELASEAIAAAFGSDLALQIAVATSQPLPTTLAGVTVRVKDGAGDERDAPLFFVSPTQINYLIPAGTSGGVAKVSVVRNFIVASGEIPVNATAPGLFTANASGQGIAAAVALRVRADGSQSVEPVARFDQGQNRFVPVPIDLGPASDQVFLILFGTGFRGRSSLDLVTATIGGEDAEVLYAGPAPGFVGLDQANVRLPRSLAGKGEVSILLTADNRSANAVTVSVR